jgi:glycerate kinase
MRTRACEVAPVSSRWRAPSGLQLLTPARRDPCRTTTRGTGELMAALLDEGLDRLVVGLGGSATNDGGAGMARALGIRFLDAAGEAIREGGAALLGLARIDARGIDPRLAAVDCVGLTDVDNPLCGPTGASATFGPQKGASPEDVWDLDHALGHLAAVAYRDLGLDLQHEPGAGRRAVWGSDCSRSVVLPAIRGRGGDGGGRVRRRAPGGGSGHHGGGNLR